MKVLLDECMPRAMGRFLTGHEAITEQKAGLAGMRNGELLRAMKDRFDVLVTVDQNLEHQQNRGDQFPAVIVLMPTNTKVDTLIRMAPQILKTLGYIRSGQVIHLSPDD